MLLEFAKEFETGVSKIDDQHKELINKLNAVVASGMNSATRQETEKTLKFLEDYVLKHFSEEERIQKQCNYPKYEWHKGQHQLFIKELQGLKKEYMENGPSARFTLTLNKSVIQWIIKHIKSADVELGKCYAEVMKK